MIIIGEDNYGIFQKTSKNNNYSNCNYFYCVDCRLDDAAFVNKIGKV